MKIGEIEALRQWASNPFGDNLKMRTQVVAALDYLAEVERERDEARAWHQASQEALADQLEARTKAEDQAEKFKWQVRDTCTRAEKAEAEVARLARDREAYSRQTCNLIAEVQDARADIATLRAAIAEAVSELENLDETFDYAAFCRALATLRNLTKPDTPSERIMSDKDRENPVEGAHPTQPEGEDALVEALTEVWRNSDQHIGDEAWEVAWARDLRKALASRGLVVRGEGVER